MSTANPRHLLRIEYEKAADAYLHSLPPEHFMEATPQSTQRKITLESLDLLHARRPEVQIFNELLLQYPRGPRQHIGQVVPDNMVVVHAEPIRAVGSYDLPIQPVGPLWVLEYVSKHSKRKDYDASFRKYERELKVPYALFFYPEAQELSLYRHRRGKYISVKANAAARYAISDLDLEICLLDGWMRFWYQGELLPLPADLLLELEDTRRQLVRVKEQARHAEEQARHAEEQVSQERRQKEALLAQLRKLGIKPNL